MIIYKDLECTFSNLFFWHQVALKVLIDECVNARGEAFQFSSEVQDLKGELDDLQRQHDEAVHELSKHQNDVRCTSGSNKLLI